ncbi:hypothetical protein FA95DRAFT_1612547 [Auriscalpium vulgare]|uniref:Uncharacterized protein n=1 Tax=Auriscalpium vulgare TaxID=40419 RepID=A0ACB8R6B5_9AGAM|nr:hypothetical protein FA95DRAFT_1612547 [Auriscalpium vulgare]
MTLARQADFKGKRTIGVLTKPDVIGKGSRSRDLWINVIEGRKRPLMHGYFCTRQPDDDEREKGITVEDAREHEEHTSLQKPRGPNPLKSGSEFGTSRTPLSTIEFKPMQSSLITNLFEQFNDHVRGNEGHTAMIQGNRFKKQIRGTAPTYISFLKKEYPGVLRNDAMRTSDSEDVEKPAVRKDGLSRQRKRSVPEDESANESQPKKHKASDGRKVDHRAVAGSSQPQRRPTVVQGDRSKDVSSGTKPKPSDESSDEEEELSEGNNVEFS